MKLKNLVASLALAATGVAGSAVAADVPVKIIAFNDFHGNLQSPGSFSGHPAGGADYLAGWIAKLRAENPVNSVVVHAGDMVGASPLISALFHDEPTVEVMNMMGVDISSVGNHEFDEGRDELIRLQKGGCHPRDANSCMGLNGPFTGATFKYLAANVLDQTTGRPLFPRYVIRTFSGVRMAFIGMTLENTPTIVTPTGVAGLNFNDEADTVNSLIRTLRNQGVNAIAVVVHEGGAQAGGPIGGCVGFSGAITDIVSRLDPAVDLVISGHTHQAYLCDLPVSNGKLVPVTSASSYGRLLTNIDLVLDTATRDVKSVSARQVVVARDDPGVTPNAAIAAVVDHYAGLVGPIANRVIGKIATSVTRSTSPACEHQAGDLIADSQLAATAPSGFGDARIAFMNPGGVRADFAYASSVGEGDGNVTYGEAFTVQPFGNSLVTMTLTGAQIKTALEQQFVGCTNNQPFNRVLQVSKGFEYEWDAKGGACARVVPGSVKLNGVAIQDGQTYRVTVNSFLATGGDSFLVFNEGTDRLGGAVDIDALSDALASTLVPAPTGTPYVPPALTRIRQADPTTGSCPNN
ncbi:MAG: bifunctional metallophosphatase/5'-nucleotidase [Betaproteobacteria bacterium]|nr:bifunctional metallophosphatase/5'-nucleotidase [Betaproteobacteria bacterium]